MAFKELQPQLYSFDKLHRASWIDHRSTFVPRQQVLILYRDSNLSHDIVD